MTEKKTSVSIEPMAGVQTRTSAVDKVINEIRELIKRGQLKPGDKLPNETELSSIFGTSRGPIREAVKALVVLGILEIKRGDGTYISLSSARTAVDQLLFHLLLNKTEVRELRELRYLIELGMMDLVLRNIEPKDVQELEALNARMDQLIAAGNPDILEVTDIDISFHKVIGRATKNSLVERIYDFTLELFAPSITRTHAASDAGDISTRVHKALLEGIRERSAEKTKAAILSALEVWEKYFT